MWMKLLHLGGLHLSREEVSPELRLVLLQQVLKEGAEAEDGLRVGGHLQFVIKRAPFFTEYRRHTFT